jgi:hypothetical protein
LPPIELDVRVGRQPVFLVLPAHGRQRLAVPGHVERKDTEVPGDLGVIQQMAPLLVVGAGGVETHEGNARARLFEVHAAPLPANGESDVTSGDGLQFTMPERGRGGAGGRDAAHATYRQHLLHVAQVLHQDEEIALDHRVAGLHHREEIVIAGLRDRLPELPPALLGSTDREAPVTHQERAALHARDEERHGEEAAAAHEAVVSVHELRQSLEHARHHSP